MGEKDTETDYPKLHCVGRRFAAHRRALGIVIVLTTANFLAKAWTTPAVDYLARLVERDPRRVLAVAAIFLGFVFIIVPNSRRVALRSSIRLAASIVIGAIALAAPTVLAPLLAVAAIMLASVSTPSNEETYVTWSDAPIANAALDLLDRKATVEQIVDTLVCAPNPRVALFGRQGTGKTSIARLVVERLPSEFHVVWFDPWRYIDQQIPIRVAVLRCLEASIMSSDRTLRRVASETLGDWTEGSRWSRALLEPLLDALHVGPGELREQLKELAGDRRVLFVADNIERARTDHVEQFLMFAVEFLGQSGIGVLALADRELLCGRLPTPFAAAPMGKFFTHMFDVPACIAFDSFDETMLTAGLAGRLTSPERVPSLKDVADFLPPTPRERKQAIWQVSRCHVACWSVSPKLVRATKLLSIARYYSPSLTSTLSHSEPLLLDLSFGASLDTLRQRDGEPLKSEVRQQFASQSCVDCLEAVRAMAIDVEDLRVAIAWVEGSPRLEVSPATALLAAVETNTELPSGLDLPTLIRAALQVAHQISAAETNTEEQRLRKVLASLSVIARPDGGWISPKGVNWVGSVHELVRLHQLCSMAQVDQVEVVEPIEGAMRSALAEVDADDLFGTWRSLDLASRDRAVHGAQLLAPYVDVLRARLEARVREVAASGDAYDSQTIEVLGSLAESAMRVSQGELERYLRTLVRTEDTAVCGRTSRRVLEFIFDKYFESVPWASIALSTPELISWLVDNARNGDLSRGARERIRRQLERLEGRRVVNAREWLALFEQTDTPTD